MEKKSPLMIRFPSQIPPVYTAYFPPERGSFTIIDHEAWSLENKALDQRNMFLVNPPSLVLKHLLDKFQNPKNITLIYDHLPEEKEEKLFHSFRIIVPSLYFYYLFRQQAEEVELTHPLPVKSQKDAQARKEARKYLMLKNEVCLWIDDRLISPRYRKGLLLVVSKLQSQHPDLKVVRVSQKREDPVHPVRMLSSEEADAKKLWLAGDVLVTLGSRSQSMVPVHIQCLANQLAVITDDQGDHGEWVNHSLTGFLLSQKGMFQELRRYLLRLLHRRDMLQNFQRNGPLLIEKVLNR